MYIYQIMMYILNILQFHKSVYLNKAEKKQCEIQSLINEEDIF